MNIYNAVKEFYYEMTVKELQQLNKRESGKNITYNSIMYLDIISYKEKCTVSSLAQLLNISKSAVTIKVNELISQGLVCKTQSQEDKRVFYLSVSPEIWEEGQKQNNAFAGAIKKLKQDFSMQELETFCKVLDDLGKRIWEEL